MTLFVELPDAETLNLAERLLSARPVIPDGYSGMHRQELALALKRTADSYIERQFQLYASAIHAH